MSANNLTHHDEEPRSSLATITPERTMASGRRKLTDVDGNPSESFNLGQYLGCTQYRDWFVSECGPVTARTTRISGLDAPVRIH